MRQIRQQLFLLIGECPPVYFQYFETGHLTLEIIDYLISFVAILQEYTFEVANKIDFSPQKLSVFSIINEYSSGKARVFLLFIVGCFHYEVGFGLLLPYLDDGHLIL